MSYVIINASREAYGKDKVETMTVSELIEALADYDPDSKVILSHDGGYTYGGLRRWNIEDDYECDE